MFKDRQGLLNNIKSKKNSKTNRTANFRTDLWQNSTLRWYKVIFSTTKDIQKCWIKTHRNAFKIHSQVKKNPQAPENERDIKIKAGIVNGS